MLAARLIDKAIGLFWRKSDFIPCLFKYSSACLQLKVDCKRIRLLFNPDWNVSLDFLPWTGNISKLKR